MSTTEEAQSKLLESLKLAICSNVILSLYYLPIFYLLVNFSKKNQSVDDVDPNLEAILNQVDQARVPSRLVTGASSIRPNS